MDDNLDDLKPSSPQEPLAELENLEVQEREVEDLRTKLEDLTEEQRQALEEQQDINLSAQIQKQLMGMPLAERVRMGKALKKIYTAPREEKKERPVKPPPKGREELVKRQKKARTEMYVTPPPKAMVEARKRGEDD